MNMRNPSISIEDVTRAVKLIEQYKPAPGMPTVTLLVASINLRPTLTFFLYEQGSEDPHAIYFEDNPYFELNGYDNVTRGRFAEGIKYLEVLVNACRE